MWGDTTNLNLHLSLCDGPPLLVREEAVLLCQQGRGKVKYILARVYSIDLCHVQKTTGCSLCSNRMMKVETKCTEGCVHDTATKFPHGDNNVSK
jgi:hypothetical protein